MAEFVTLKGASANVSVNPERVAFIAEHVIDWGDANTPRKTEIVLYFDAPGGNGLVLDESYTREQVIRCLGGR